MNYSTAVSMYELFGEGKYGEESFNTFLLLLLDENVITIRQWQKYLKKFRKND